MINELIEQIGGRERLAKLVAQYDEEGYCDVQDDEVIAALRALLAVLDAKPTYYIHRVEACDSYGPEVDLRVFIYELDASKCKDDHGGEVIEVFTTPPAASMPNLKQVGYLWVSEHGGVVYSPSNRPIKGLHCAGPIFGDISDNYLLAAAPAPENKK